MKVRYLATYQGPSYGGCGTETMDAFESIGQAKLAMKCRQEARGDYVTTYRENNNQNHVLWESSTRYDFPTTTTEDTMELWRATEGENGELSIGGYPDIRLSVGTRGGIIVEKF